MKRENKSLRLLLDITKTIACARTTDDLFALIVSRIPEVLEVDAATIRLLDPTGKKLILKAASGLSETYLNRGPIDAEESVLSALKGTPIAIVDAANDKRVQYPQSAAQEGIQSLLVAPIPIRDEVGGILRLLSRTRREFDPLEIDLAAALAEQCGICIQNVRYSEEQQRQIKYFKAVCEISKSIGENRQLDSILDFIVKTMPRVMDVKACTIRLIESSKGKLELKAAFGLSDTYLQRGPLDDEMATFFILKGEPVVIPDATSDIHTLYHQDAAKEGVGSILAVPIAIQGETIGMLRLLTAEQRYFSESDINFAISVAEQGGIAIQNAIDYQKMTKMLETCRSKGT